MATCPTCLTHYDDDVHVCAQDGQTLLPDDAIGLDPELRAGDRVGEYVIEAKIGAGSFGAVYRAIQPLIGKQVAVKVLSRKYSADPHVVSRFIAEARAVNQIRHKNIIDIFAFGQLPDRRHYHVMELLDGQPLDLYLAEAGGRLPVEVMLAVLRGLGRALDGAHAAGIAHRDLKPANVFLAKDDDGTPFPKLLDFGIAKLLNDEVPRHHHTATGAAVGTPDYMSPEQCQGPDVDHRTDIYSFGVLTYQLLTGHLPHTGNNVVEVLMKQMTAEPRPPSAVGPHVSPSFDAPVLHMLAKAPQDRPANCALAVQGLIRAAIEAGFEVPSGSHSGDLDARLVRSGPGAHPSPSTPPWGSTPPPNPAVVPSALAATLASSSGEQAPDLGPRPKGRAALWLGMAVMIAAVAAVPFVLDSSAPKVAKTSAPPKPVAPPAPATEPAAATPAPSEPLTVQLAVAGAPDGTKIFGPGGVQLGEAANALELPQGNDPLQLMFRAEGYDDLTREIVPVASGTITVSMVPTRTPVKKRRASRKKRPGKDDLEVPTWEN